MTPRPEIIRVWRRGPFHLQMWETSNRDPRYLDLPALGPVNRLGYRFRFHGKTIFEGQDFGPSPLHPIDSDESVAALLHFLALRPGDVEEEYFETYTEGQMNFAIDHGEELAILALELEEEPHHGLGN